MNLLLKLKKRKHLFHRSGRNKMSKLISLKRNFLIYQQESLKWKNHHFQPCLLSLKRRKYGREKTQKETEITGNAHAHYHSQIGWFRMGNHSRYAERSAEKS